MDVGTSCCSRRGCRSGCRLSTCYWWRFSIGCYVLTFPIVRYGYIDTGLLGKRYPQRCLTADFFNLHDFDQLRSSSGLNLEQIKKTKTRKGNPVYSFRITRSFRAIPAIEGDYLRFISLHPDHDSAYKR